MAGSCTRFQNENATMKNIALVLLFAAALVYILATVLEGQHSAWGYVAACAEAAMVGALADWFAVTALFRHPMGLPIPHTAVIANNQHRIGQGLADFLDQNFLATEPVRARLRDWDGAAWLAHWLQQPAQVQAWTQPLIAATRFGLNALDEASVQTFIARNAKAALQQLDFSGSARVVLNSLTTNNRHQELLDEVLVALARLLDSETTQQHISEAIAKELRALRYLALDKAAARLTTRKIVAAVARNVAEMGEDPAHPLRQRFDQAVHEWVQRLEHDPVLRAQVTQMGEQIINHPTLQEYLLKIWDDLRQWLDHDLNRPDSTVRQGLERLCSQWGQQLQDNPALQHWLNAQIQQLVPQVLDHYRPAIRKYVTERVSAWDTRELVREVEEHLGRDLQYIRINGTLVGGLVGLTIYSLTEWVKAWW